MSDTVRVGVIGTSWFADLMHLPNLKSHPRAEIAAICGRNRSRAQEMADKYSIPQVYTDYRELIDKAHVDAVVIITPDHMHYPMTMVALEAGLHVLCEKPLAMNADQAREMLNKAEEAGVKHMTFFTYRWLPSYRYLRQLVEAGTIGRCYHCDFRYLAGYGRQPQYWWGRDSRLSTGTLGNLGSHVIDMLHWLVGDIARVHARLSSFVDHPGPDGGSIDLANDWAALTLEFENGARGVLQVSSVANEGERGQEQRLSLYGEQGALEYEQNYIHSEIRLALDGKSRFETLSIPEELTRGVDPGLPLFAQALQMFQTQPIGDRAFIDAILEDRPVKPDFEDGLKVVEVIDAAVESDRTGCWVSVGV